MVPASTIFDKPEGGELVQPMPAPSVPSSASSVASRDLASSQHTLVVDFLASIPAHAKPVQMLFMLPVAIPGPPAQYPMIVLAKDSCTPVQYNGLVATQQKEATAGKSKAKAIPSNNESDYGEEESKQEHDLEEDKTSEERMQQIAQNKCIAKKKANIAAAHAAQIKKAVNNLLERVPNRLM
ncbi:hypothetical protein C0993_006214 [Termitomyces sp. T159_Od127]|nr:hypothetical protein C0993_006214 [Termitomyces sp. T159_Od127]